MASSQPAQRRARFSSLSHPASDLFSRVDGRPFVTQCQLLVACASDCPPEVITQWSGTSWLPASIDEWSFCRARGTLTEIATLYRGQPDKLYAVSESCLRASSSGCDEVAMVPGSGALHLCLVQDSYAQLGLTGVKRGDRYSVCLTSKRLQKQEVQRMLRNVVSEVGVAAVTADGLAARAAEMEPLRDVESEALSHSTCRLQLGKVALMEPMAGWARDCIDSEDCGHLQDWLGALSCAAATAVHSSDIDEQSSVAWDLLQPPYAAGGTIVCHQWDGLMAPPQIRAILDAGRSMLQDGHARWVCLASCQSATHYRANVSACNESKCSGKPVSRDEGSFILLLSDDQYIHMTCASEEL